MAVQSNTIFLGLGGNQAQTISLLQQALKLISAIPKVSNLKPSSFYQTTPVEMISQDLFINCVCQLQTTLDPYELFAELEEIEKKLGKVSKAKNEPRPIDIDLLLYSDLFIDSEKLTIPHPKWKERLFVLIPLRELTKIVVVSTINGKVLYDIDKMLNAFENKENEVVTLITQN